MVVSVYFFGRRVGWRGANPEARESKRARNTIVDFAIVKGSFLFMKRSEFFQRRKSFEEKVCHHMFASRVVVIPVKRKQSCSETREV